MTTVSTEPDRVPDKCLVTSCNSTLTLVSNSLVMP